MVTRSTPKLSSVTDSYLDDRKDDIVHEAWKHEVRFLLRFVRHVGDKQVGRLVASDVEGFFRCLRRGEVATLDGKTPKPFAPHTYNNAVGQMRLFIRWCYRRGFCRGDLVDGIKLMPKVARRNFLRLTADELLRLIDAAEHPRDRALLAGAANTGLRGKESLDLRLGWVDLDAGSLYAQITKTGDADHLPITKDLDAEMRRWLTFYASQVDGPLQGDWYLFPAKHRNLFTGQGLPSPGKLRPTVRMGTDPSRLVRACLAKLGYEETGREGMHTIRRSVARIYFDNCAEAMGYSNALREVMALLHHSSVATTERYLGVDVERNNRDRRMRGREFLTLDRTNVVDLASRVQA